MEGKGFRRLIVPMLIVIGVLVIVVIALLGRGSGGTVAPSRSPSRATISQSASPTTSPVASSSAVDPNVATRGWVPEPITQDPDVYVRAALEAAATFDTRHATRDQWVAWLGTWFTPSPLYDHAQDALDQMAGYKAELNQTVLIPQSQWDDLAKNDGRVSGRVDGQIVYSDQADATLKHVRTATANVLTTFTQAGDSAAGDASYEQTVRVSVQVVCGGESVPTSGSAQRAGDCKVVRFFDTAVG